MTRRVVAKAAEAVVAASIYIVDGQRKESVIGEGGMSAVCWSRWGRGSLSMLGALANWGCRFLLLCLRRLVSSERSFEIF